MLFCRFQRVSLHPLNIYCKYSFTIHLYSLVKCTVEKARECEGREGCRRDGPGDYDCHMLGFAKECVEEMKPNCLGFFKTQTSRYAGWWKKYGGSGGPRPSPIPMPECLEVYLPNEIEEETETEETMEFPNFNKLVDELIMIKKLLNKP